MRRPLAYIGFSFLFSLMIAILTDIGVFILLILVGLLFATSAFLYSRRPVTSLTIMVIAISAIFAQLYLMLFNNVIIDMDDVSSGTHNITGIVISTDSSAYATSEIEVKIISSETLSKGTVIGISQAPIVDVGDMISCTVDIMTNTVNDTYDLRNGVFITGIYAGNMSVISNGHGREIFFLQIQTWLTEIINTYLSPEIAGVAAALVYGDRTGLEYSILKNFSRSGLSHVLVVSGLHLSILSAILLPVFNKILRKKVIVYSALILFVIFYTLLCGVRLSVLRAAFVVIMISVSNIISRRADTYSSLGLGALLITLTNPYSSVDLSLLLSLFATIGILYGNDLFKPIMARIKTFNRHIAWLISITLTTCLAIVATMPVFAAIEDGFSLLAVPANILSALLVAPIISFILIGLLLGGLGISPLAEVAFTFAEALITLLLSTANAISNIEWQYINFVGGFPFVLMLIAFSVGVVVFLNDRPYYAVISGVIIVLFGAVSYNILDHDTIHLAVVGDTLNPVIVMTKNNEAAVIYRATKSNNDAVIEYLNARNIDGIDSIIDISHAESTLDLTADVIVKFNESQHYTNSLTILDNVVVELRRQENSNVCLLNVGGVTATISSGETDYEGYSAQTLVVAGSYELRNFDSEYVFAKKPSVIIASNVDMLSTDDFNEFWIRPYHSYMIV